MNQDANRYVVSILGSKGGSGKTLTSHILSLGLSLRGFPTILATTDADRVVRNFKKRGYTTYKAQSDSSMTKLFNQFKTMELERTSLIVIDGGASRDRFDVEIASNSSLVLIPFLKDVEDIEVAIKDVENLRVNLSKEDFAGVKLLPTRFPTNSWAAESTRQLFAQMFSDEHRNMMLPPVIEMSSAAKLNRDEETDIATDVKSMSRYFADAVLTEVEEDPFQYSGK